MCDMIITQSYLITATDVIWNWLPSGLRNLTCLFDRPFQESRWSRLCVYRACASYKIMQSCAGYNYAVRCIKSYDYAYVVCASRLGLGFCFTERRAVIISTVIIIAIIAVL